MLEKFDIERVLMRVREMVETRVLSPHVMEALYHAHSVVERDVDPPQTVTVSIRPVDLKLTHEPTIARMVADGLLGNVAELDYPCENCELVERREEDNCVTYEHYKLCPRCCAVAQGVSIGKSGKTNGA